MLEPMNPAAPVTMIMTMLPRLFRQGVVGEAREELLAMDDGGAELADHDAGRVVRHAHRGVQVGARGHHERERRDHGVARAAHVEHLARARRLVAASRWR